MLFLQEIRDNYRFSNPYNLLEIRNRNYEDIPHKQGVYVIFVPENISITILETSSARDTYTKNGITKSMLRSQDELLKKYEAGDGEIIYIGQSGDLNRRLKQYIEQGFGKPLSHRGGIAIFQIKEWSSLQLIFIETEEPEGLEKELLKKYKDNNDKIRPFANWKG